MASTLEGVSSGCGVAVEDVAVLENARSIKNSGYSSADDLSGSFLQDVS